MTHDLELHGLSIELDCSDFLCSCKHAVRVVDAVVLKSLNVRNQRR